MKKLGIILLLGFLGGFFLRELLGQRPVAAVKIVTIKSRNLEFEVETRAQTVEEVFVAEGFSPPYGNLKVSVTLQEPIKSGMVVEVSKAVNVNLIDGGNEKQFTTTAATVGDFLFGEKIGLAKTDRLRPSESSYLTEGVKIIIDRIVDLEVPEINEIPYEIRYENDPTTYYGIEEVVRPGYLGTKEEKFLITYKNGVEIKRKLLSSKVLEKPIAEFRRLGTKIEIEEVREGGASWYATKKCQSAYGGCAAHPFYAKGRFVRVTSLKSGKSIIVKINDRGPELDKHPDRVIDLDAAAFSELAPLLSGTIGVRVELLK